MTRPAPDISVCIANFNGGRLVLDCIESVYAQSGDFTFEVIVHDDCSTDGSAERIEETFASVRMIRGDVNRGFCVSNNRMAEAATGRFLLLLNNDAVLRPGSFQRLFEYAGADHGDCILGLPQFALEDGALVDRGYDTDPFLNPIPVTHVGPREVGVATGACLWIPIAVWREIGGFPDWFESVAEDIFLCTAARLLGHRVVVLDGPGFDHWVGRQLGGGKVVRGKLQTTSRRRRLSERNKTYGMLCCHPWPALLVLLPLHFLLLLTEALLLLATGTRPAQVRAIYLGLPGEIYRNHNRIARLRGDLASARKVKCAEYFSKTKWLPAKLMMVRRHGMPRID